MIYSVGIAAGGKSSRFGSDKRQAILKDRSFLEIALDNFSSFDDLILSVDKMESIPESLNNNVKIVVDQNVGIGPIEAISQILMSAENDYSFIFPVDMPLVTCEVSEYLSSFISENVDAICPVVKGREFPLCAIYHKRVLSEIIKLKQEGNYRLRSLLCYVRTKYVDISCTCFDERIFSNINTPEDYISIKEYLGL